MDGNFWITLGATGLVIGTLVGAVAIPYGFHLKGREEKALNNSTAILGDIVRGDKVNGSKYAVKGDLVQGDKILGERSPSYSNNPEVEVSISSDKVLYVTNKGPHDLEDIKIFVTEYWLKKESFLKKPEIADFQLTKEPLYQQLELKIKDQIKLSLSELPRFRFYENPGHGEDDDPILKNYALRIFARNSFSKQKYVHYELTSPIKNFASLVDNYGTIRAGQYSDFITDLPGVLKAHQRKLFGDSSVEEI